MCDGIGVSLIDFHSVIVEIGDCWILWSERKGDAFVQEVDAKVKELRMRQTIPTLNNKQMSLKTSLKNLKEKNVEMDEKVSLLSNGIQS
jgi:uncharacterized coiled-coil DUF342 family protein